tara:strand:- start:37586 stop:38056 length:471 start_codon:yes stop_codon:yes gene_type:complete
MTLKHLVYLLIFISCTPTQDTPDPIYIPSTHSYTSDELTYIDALNSVRVSNGVDRLLLSDDLSSLAKSHVDYLSFNQVINHYNYGDRLYSIESIGFNGLSENVAYGYTNVNSLISAWLNSVGHRDNLLDIRHTYHGFAIGLDVDGSYYYVHLFSRK